MVDYAATLQRLRDIDWKINNFNNIDELNSLISKRSSDLYSALSSNDFFINQDVAREIDNIEGRLSIWWSLVREAQREISNLVTERTWLPAWAGSNTRRSEIWREIWKFLRITWGTETAPWDGSTTRILDRYNDYHNIKLAKDSFDIDNRLIDHPYTMWVWNAYTWLNSATNFWCTPLWWFMLFDDVWKKINSVWWKYKFKMKLNNWTEAEVEVEWISIVWNDIIFENDVKFNPSNIDFSKPLELNIWGVYENVWWTWMNVIHLKTLKVNISNPEFLSTEPLREWEFDNYNNSGTWNKISHHLSTRYRTDHHSLEREAIERALKDWDWPKYDQLSDEQKEQFYQYIRTVSHPSLGWELFDTLNSSMHLDEYDYFKNWFVADDKDWNKWENISSKRKYNYFIHNNLESKSKEYISSSFDRALIDSLPTNRFLKWEFTEFLDRLERNKQDSNIHKRVESDISGKSHDMEKGPWSILNNRDKNYMRFFTNSSKQIDNQEVNVNTNTAPEDLNNPQPVKYNMKLDISGKNNIQVTIDIDWNKDEILVKSGDPASLVRRVMRDQRVKQWKVRAHIAYNIYKWMIEMAKDKDISLTYRQDNNYMRKLDIDADGNIVLQTIDGRTNRNTTNKADRSVLFSQQMFENTNDFDTANYNGSLRHWIENISKHFNAAMNQVHTQYRGWVKRRLLGAINSPSRPKLPTSIWLSPIKKLLNLGKNTKFDFDTTVESNWKQINIKFEKNKFTINMDWLKKEISSRDLWKLLRKRQWKQRVFDGMERDIVEWVYSAMIWQLRTNAKVANSSFGAIDDLTWNMYILDDDGNFWLITKEQLDTKWNPVHRWLFSRNKYGVLNNKKLKTDWHQPLNESQTRELMKNPFLMQRLMKSMNKRMWFWESARAILN